MYLPAALAGLALLLPAVTPARAASDGNFHVSYHIERTDRSRVSVDQCSEIAQREADGAGFAQSLNKSSPDLATVSGGPAAGGSAFIVHCIGDGDRLVYVVQGFDYDGKAGAASAYADRVWALLLKAGQ